MQPTPKQLARQMTLKSDGDLWAMVASPDDWTPEALSAARQELENRGAKPFDQLPTEPPGEIEDTPSHQEPLPQTEVRENLTSPQYRVSNGRLHLASVCALLTAVVAIVITVSYGDLRQNAAEAIGELIGKLLMFAGAVAWAVFGTSKSRKRYTFLCFSAIFTIVTLVFSVYYWTVTYPSNRSDDQLATNLNHFVDKTESGAVPQISPTGDKELDPVLKAFNDLVHDLYGSLDKMEQEIQELKINNVYSASVLQSSANIQAEIDKRVAAKAIIQRYQAAFPDMIASARTRLSSVQTSDEARTGALRGFDSGVERQTPQLQTMFSLRLQRQDSEEKLLRFMLSTFGDYQVTEKSILFKHPANVEQYNTLNQSLEKTISDAEAFEKAEQDTMEEQRAKIQHLFQ